VDKTRIGRICICAGAFFLIATALLPAQAEEEKPPWLFAGMRLGLTGAIADPGDFTRYVQSVFPGYRQYFPLYTQVGLGLQQRVPLGFASGRLVFQELILVSGLDQNFALPLLGLLMGYRFPFGLDISLGPELTLGRQGADIVLLPALMYSVGWYFDIGNFSIPVLLLYNPLPPDRKMKFTLLSGFDFGVRIRLAKREKEKTPFNY
jgi:hypothetical protein